ncbi:hypothetical protein KY289_007903 [Solanum tuberosum]|nr:hypothetical protein KY289_007903 [Solanum tuberosum]
MAKKLKQRGRGQQIQVEYTSNMMGKKKVPQSGDARQTNSINVLQGIVPLNLVQTPPQMGNPVTGSPSSWADQVEEEAMLEQKSSESHLSPPSSAHSWSKIVGKGEATEVNRGVFLVRFHCQESRSKVVESGVQMFDRKPVVVKPWRLEIKLNKEVIDKVPIWIRLVGLDIKYWGENTLTKIAGLVGNPLKAGTTTTNKVRLTYARVLMVMPLNKEYPTGEMFENEVGKIVEQKVECEWKPVWCTKCKNYGHELKECRRQQREVVADNKRDDGQQRGMQVQEEAQVDKIENGHGREVPFQRVKSLVRRILHTPNINIPTGNNYEALNKDKGELNHQAMRQMEKGVSYLKSRRSTNRIFTVKDINGVQHTEIAECYNSEWQSGTKTQRECLTKEFMKEEVKQALWAIDGNKSLGPDGYGSKFFKDCWGTVGEDITKGILEYFQNGEMLRGVNDTVITLIQKGRHVENVTDYKQKSLICFFDRIALKSVFEALGNKDLFTN